MGCAHTKQLFLVYLKFVTNQDPIFAEAGSRPYESTLRPSCRPPCPLTPAGDLAAVLGSGKLSLEASPADPAVPPARCHRVASYFLHRLHLALGQAQRGGVGDPSPHLPALPPPAPSLWPPTMSRDQKLEPGEWTSPSPAPQAWSLVCRKVW